LFLRGTCAEPAARRFQRQREQRAVLLVDAIAGDVTVEQLAQVLDAAVHVRLSLGNVADAERGG
jgi:hypothetical protein